MICARIPVSFALRNFAGSSAPELPTSAGGLVPRAIGGRLPPVSRKHKDPAPEPRVPNESFSVEPIVRAIHGPRLTSALQFFHRSAPATSAVFVLAPARPDQIHRP